MPTRQGGRVHNIVDGVRMWVVRAAGNGEIRPFPRQGIEFGVDPAPDHEPGGWRAHPCRRDKERPHGASIEMVEEIGGEDPLGGLVTERQIPGFIWNGDDNIGLANTGQARTVSCPGRDDLQPSTPTLAVVGDRGRGGAAASLEAPGRGSGAASAPSPLRRIGWQPQQR